MTNWNNVGVVGTGPALVIVFALPSCSTCIIVKADVQCIPDELIVRAFATTVVFALLFFCSSIG